MKKGFNWKRFVCISKKEYKKHFGAESLKKLEKTIKEIKENEKKFNLK